MELKHNDMKRFRYCYIISLLLPMAFSSCGFDDYDISYPEKKVLFTYQQYNRQLVVGEGLKLKVGFVFSGLPENDRDRLVNLGAF